MGRKKKSRHRKKRLCHRIIPMINGPVIWIKRLFDPSLPDREKILRIRTDDIKLFIYNDFLNRNCTFQGDVVGGDWDLNVRTKEDIVANTDKYIGLREHFIDGLPWEETSLFKNEYAKRLASGRTIKGADTIKDLAKVYERKYDSLYEQLKATGFQSTKENPNVDPVYIYIGRNGELIYTSNGNHRLAMAFMHDIEVIPVVVWWRHEKWHRIRKEYLRLSKAQRQLKYPSLDLHPDLADS